MKNKEIIEEKVGYIIEIFIPEVYDDEYNEFLEGDEIHYIGFRIDVDGEVITIVKPAEDKYCNLYVNDKVNVINYKYFDDYMDYCERLFEKINTYNLSKTHEEKENIFNMYVLDEDDDYYVVDYDLEKM